MSEEEKATACVKFYCGDCAPKGKKLDNGTFLAECSKCGTKTYSKAARSLCGAIQVDAGITAPEPELAEETEAIKEVAEEALEEILEDIKEEDIPPEEPELEAESEPSANKAEIAELEAKLEALKK